MNKEIEGLQVYNAQLESRIQNQLDRIAEIETNKATVDFVRTGPHFELGTLICDCTADKRVHR